MVSWWKMLVLQNSSPTHVFSMHHLLAICPSIHPFIHSFIHPSTHPPSIYLRSAPKLLLPSLLLILPYPPALFLMNCKLPKANDFTQPKAENLTCNGRAYYYWHGRIPLVHPPLPQYKDSLIGQLASHSASA